jgi:hypothetical protein
MQKKNKSLFCFLVTYNQVPSVVNDLVGARIAETNFFIFISALLRDQPDKKVVWIVLLALHKLWLGHGNLASSDLRKLQPTSFA